MSINIEIVCKTCGKQINYRSEAFEGEGEKVTQESEKELKFKLSRPLFGAVKYTNCIDCVRDSN